jgi:hypothetical protein
VTVKLTQEVVRELLRYEKTTGNLFWRTRDRRWFTSERGWKMWNSRYAGKRAFTAKIHGGDHLQGTVLYLHCYAHQVIWLWMTGEWPEEIDHKNRIGTDNRWKNLKKSTRLENLHNMSLRRNVSNEHCGVRRVGKKFKAVITVNYKRIYLGYFSSVKDAVVAREVAKRKYGFSRGHGLRRPMR